MRELTEDERRVRVTKHLIEMNYRQPNKVAGEILIDAASKITGAVSKEDKKAVVEKLIKSLAPKDEEKPSP